MARFKYLGEPAMQGVTWGPCLKIRISCSDGSVEEYLPIEPATEFVIGEDTGHEFTKDRCLRHMRADTGRFEEII